VMQSRGGLAGTAVARQRPVRLFLSGPAAGVIGGRITGTSSGFDNVITIDVGGTSADIALISRQKPMIRQEAVIADFEVRVAMVDVNTIGSGGGSIARIDAAGGLRVGPDSAGAEPGPACYDRGGENPTVTDASIVLGYLDPDYFAGGSLKLKPQLSDVAIRAKVAEPLGLTAEQAALGIHRVLNAQMAEGIRLVSIRQGADPRDFALLPLGGGGGIHATALARELGMTTVLVPPAPGVLSASGLLAASTEHEVSTALPMRLDEYDPARIRNAAASLDTRATSLMQADGVKSGDVTIMYFADVCYVGQAYTLEVSIDPERSDAESIGRDFLAAHDRAYGYAAEAPARIVNIRTIHVAGGVQSLPPMSHPSPDVKIEKGRRRIITAEEPGGVEAIVLDRMALPAGFEFAGPAIVEQPDTTTVVETGWRGSVDPAGNLILTLRKEARND
jgi:N-methylhydantoinase A